MKSIVWLLSTLVFIIWSAIAYFAHWAIGFGGRLAADNADQVPTDAETIEQISEWTRWGASVGEWGVIAVWALGALVIYGISYLINKTLTSRGATLPTRDYSKPE